MEVGLDDVEAWRSRAKSAAMVGMVNLHDAAEGLRLISRSQQEGEKDEASRGGGTRRRQRMQTAGDFSTLPIFWDEPRSAPH
jgi:hypothetical protein